MPGRHITLLHWHLLSQQRQAGRQADSQPASQAGQQARQARQARQGARRARQGARQQGWEPGRQAASQAATQPGSQAARQLHPPPAQATRGQCLLPAAAVMAYGPLCQCAARPHFAPQRQERESDGAYPYERHLHAPVFQCILWM